VAVAKPIMRAYRAVLEATAASLGQSIDGEVCTDLARVLRPPSSFNTKATPIRVRIYEDDGRVYGPDDLAELFGSDTWERCQRGSEESRVPPPDTNGRMSADWEWITPEPLAARVTGDVIVELLIEDGWHVDRHRDRDGDDYWSLTRPGKTSGCSATVRQFPDHAVLWVFSESDDAAPFEAGVPYGARSFLAALYGLQWPDHVRRPPVEAHPEPRRPAGHRRRRR
jgi:hypothetical protein